MNGLSYSQRVKAFRENRGWSQEQLSEISDLSVRTVQRIESGQPASLETLKAIAAAFDLDVQDLTKTDQEHSRNAKVAFLVRVSTGKELLNIVGGADAFEFDHDELGTESEVELVGYFLQELKDTGDLWNDLEPIDHVRDMHTYTVRLQELEQEGFFVFALRYPQQ